MKQLGHDFIPCEEKAAYRCLYCPYEVRPRELEHAKTLRCLSHEAAPQPPPREKLIQYLWRGIKECIRRDIERTKQRGAKE